MTTTRRTMVLMSALTVTVAGAAYADQTMPAAGAEKSYTGQVVAVDPLNHTMNVKSWMLSDKGFNLGDNCAYVLAGVNNATVRDLRPGQEVTVRYQDSQGVRIADRIEQRAMQYEGMVAAIDPNKHTLTLHESGMDKPLMIADGCNVVLRDNKAGVLSDIQPGDHITVTYETPNGEPMARQIAQTSMEFTGRLTAIDLDQKMVKAKDTFGTKKFNLANNCAIVINGKTDGKLSQLTPNERLEFTYDAVNGVNVVNRIAPAPVEEQRNTVTTTTPSYPGGF